MSVVVLGFFAVSAVVSVLHEFVFVVLVVVFAVVVVVFVAIAIELWHRSSVFSNYGKHLAKRIVII